MRSKNTSISEWRSFSDDIIGEMADDALKWWTTHKQVVFALSKLTTSEEEIWSA